AEKTKQSLTCTTTPTLGGPGRTRRNYRRGSQRMSHRFRVGLPKTRTRSSLGSSDRNLFAPRAKIKQPCPDASARGCSVLPNRSRKGVGSLFRYTGSEKTPDP